VNPLVRTFGKQFSRPHGLLGRLAARAMRGGNAPLNLWMVDLLHVAPGDRVLEVGFGPGVALAALLERASAGFVAGVDTSGLMVRQARSRHAEAIAAGRLELHEGDAGSLPFADASFDKVCGAHVIYFWPDPVVTVGELRRVLRPGGTLAVGYQERERMPSPARASLPEAGARLYGPGEVEQVVRAAGFAKVQVETQGAPDRPGGFCVLAVK
jgi:SAM-dependent methyltransferase